MSAVDALVESAVGMACMVAATGVWRRPGLRIVAVVLAVAGLIAVVHAIVSLV